MVRHVSAVALLWAPAAAMMTLSSVELLTTISASINCVLAYNTPILGCQINAFVRGNFCTDQCRQALETAQNNIQEACDGLPTPKGSLINEAQNGNLLGALCNNGDKNTPTESPPQTSSADNIETTIKITISEPTSTTQVTVTKITTSELSKTNSPITTHSPSTETTTLPQETTTSTPLTTRITLEPTSTSSSRHTTSTAPPEAVRGPVGGGGGPGDPGFFSGARKMECSVVLFAATVVMALLV